MNQLPSTIRLATRRSPLARWQTERVQELIHSTCPSAHVEIVQLDTRGDRERDKPLADIGGKGSFTQALEQAILEGSADIAVHSMKDVPTEFDPAFAVVSVGTRADPSDALVGHPSLVALPSPLRVGTSSHRRQAMLKLQSPAVDVVPVRGNVETRLAKLDAGDLDALVLATAGLERLGLAGRIGQRIPPEVFVPAVGQGVLAVEFCRNRAEIAELVGALQDPETEKCVSAERAVIHGLGGDCASAIGVYCRPEKSEYRLTAIVLQPDGSHSLTSSLTDRNPVVLANRTVVRLAAAGAKELIGSP